MLRKLIPHVLRVRKGAKEGCRAKESKEQGDLNRPLELAYSKPSHIVEHLGSCAFLNGSPILPNPELKRVVLDCSVHNSR